MKKRRNSLLNSLLIREEEPRTFYRVAYRDTELFEIRSFLYPHSDNLNFQITMMEQGVLGFLWENALEGFKKRWRGILTAENAYEDKNGHMGPGRYAKGCNAFFSLKDAQRYAFIEGCAPPIWFLKFEGIQISKIWYEEQERRPMPACIVKPTKLLEKIAPQ